MTETNTDRDPKWQLVRGGDLLHAGQPYRLEYGDECSVALKATRDATAVEGIIETDSVAEVAPRGVERFVDSSWKPPLVLPTEPTWGIVATKGYRTIAGRWHRLNGVTFFNETAESVSPDDMVAWIPFTDEQVQRIEAAR